MTTPYAPIQSQIRRILLIGFWVGLLFFLGALGLAAFSETLYYSKFLATAGLISILVTSPIRGLVTARHHWHRGETRLACLGAATVAVLIILAIFEAVK